MKYDKSAGLFNRAKRGSSDMKLLEDVWLAYSFKYNFMNLPLFYHINCILMILIYLYSQIDNYCVCQEPYVFDYRAMCVRY